MAKLLGSDVNARTRKRRRRAVIAVVRRRLVVPSSSADTTRHDTTRHDASSQAKQASKQGLLVLVLVSERMHRWSEAAPVVSDIR